MEIGVGREEREGFSRIVISELRHAWKFISTRGEGVVADGPSRASIR
jgi:hypothetical protein